MLHDLEAIIFAAILTGLISPFLSGISEGIAEEANGKGKEVGKGIYSKIIEPIFRYFHAGIKGFFTRWTIDENTKKHNRIPICIGIIFTLCLSAAVFGIASNMGWDYPEGNSINLRTDFIFTFCCLLLFVLLAVKNEKARTSMNTEDYSTENTDNAKVDDAAETHLSDSGK